MAEKDWKDLLSNLNPEPNEILPKSNDEPENVKEKIFNSQDLILRFEKRNGKPATIVSNFIGSIDNLKALAGDLKKLCGAGGSAKDDEILIQGDFRQKIALYLKDLGYHVRGSIK